MYMTKTELLEVCKRHRHLFTDLSDAELTAEEIDSYMNFASDVLDSEHCAIDEKEPDLFKYSEKIREVAYCAFNLGEESYDVLNGE